MDLHPAENRGYRELYAFARNVATHWPKLAERLAGSSAERALREGAEAAAQLIADLEGKTPEYGLYGKPAAQSVGANLARTRRDVRDRFLERNQALRLSVSDLQHIVTLLGYLEQVARTRGDETLRGFCSEQRARLMPIERSVSCRRHRARVDAGRRCRAARHLARRACRARRRLRDGLRRRMARPARRRQVAATR
jgi:hypothetical protein